MFRVAKVTIIPLNTCVLLCLFNLLFGDYKLSVCKVLYCTTRSKDHYHYTVVKTIISHGLSQAALLKLGGASNIAIILVKMCFFECYNVYSTFILPVHKVFN